MNRTNISGYLEHNLLFKDFTLSAGLVAVKNTWNNKHFTVYPGVDISYRPHQDWKMQAVELGINYQHKGFYGTAVIWHHHGKNMIDWIMDTSKGSDAIWESVNHTTINSIGVELTTKLDFTQLLPSQQFLRTFTLNYSYINQDKKQEENIVSQYALEYLRHKLVGHVMLQLYHQLDLSLNVRWQDRVGSYTDFDGHINDYQPYCLTDARLTWQQRKWKLYVEANNLFDISYHDYGLVEEPGRWLIAGVSIHL